MRVFATRGAYGRPPTRPATSRPTPSALAAGELVPILGIAAWRLDVARYAISLAAIGATMWIWKGPFVSIPFMALSGFAQIATLLLVVRSAARLDADDRAATLAGDDGATAP